MEESKLKEYAEAIISCFNEDTQETDIDAAVKILKDFENEVKYVDIKSLSDEKLQEYDNFLNNERLETMRELYKRGK